MCVHPHIACALYTLKLSQAHLWLLAKVIFGSPPHGSSTAIPELVLSQASFVHAARSHTDGPVGGNKSSLLRKKYWKEFKYWRQ